MFEGEADWAAVDKYFVEKLVSEGEALMIAWTKFERDRDAVG